jgi:hypothetical protein
VTIYKTITVKNKNYSIGFHKLEFDYEAYVLDAASNIVPIKFSIGNSMASDMGTVAGRDYREVVADFLGDVMKRAVA